MSNNEYSELINFLGKQFEAIDKRFDGIDRQFEKTAEDIETLRRETGVRFEAVDHKFDLVIEGIENLNEKMDRHIEENAREHGRLERMSLINSADIANLDKRVERLEHRP